MLYAETTAKFAPYPYMREYIYTTGRLALPSLTIGVPSFPMPYRHHALTGGRATP